MTGSEYQEQAMRTNDGESTRRMWDAMFKHDYDCNMGGIVEATMGLSGEVGELTDLIKKWLFHNSDMDISHAKKELGDIMWYVACMADSFGWTLDEIMQINIDKLWKRYPNGFDIERANRRESGDV